MSSVAVQKEIPGPNGPQWSAEDYLFCLNKTAIYAVTRGLLPLLVMPHLTFLVDFVDAWLKREPDGAKKTVAALFDRWPQWSQRRIEGWVASPRIPNRGLLFLLLIPFALLLPGLGSLYLLTETLDFGPQLRIGCLGLSVLLSRLFSPTVALYVG